MTKSSDALLERAKNCDKLFLELTAYDASDLGRLARVAPVPVSFIEVLPPEYARGIEMPDHLNCRCVVIDPNCIEIIIR